MTGLVTYPSTEAGPFISFLEGVGPARIEARVQVLALVEKAYWDNLGGDVLGRHIPNTRCWSAVFLVSTGYPACNCLFRCGLGGVVVGGVIVVGGRIVRILGDVVTVGGV